MRIDPKLILSLIMALVILHHDKVKNTIGVDKNYPIDAPGIHLVFYKNRTQLLDKELSSVIGSQDLETMIEDLGGKYEVYWTDQPETAILPEHLKAYRLMAEHPNGPPQWCVACSETGKYALGPPPADLEEAKRVITEVTTK